MLVLLLAECRANEARAAPRRRLPPAALTMAPFSYSFVVIMLLMGY